jgi:conjugative transposon TraN protein
MHFFIKIYIKILLWGFLYHWGREVDAQPISEPQKIEITFNKTCSIVFPSIIKSVDRGSRDVLAQKAKGVDNVLQLKAARENFTESNLTVITGDGVLHQFTINYSAQPASLTIDAMGSNITEKATPLVFHTTMTEVDLQAYSAGILDTKRIARFVHDKTYKMDLMLIGVYIKEDVMFYRFRIRNQSNINYDIDFLKFYIRDKEKIKRTASQEVEVRPIYIYGNDNVVKGKSETDIVYALQKFTIPESKHLAVEVFEQNGGRHLDLTIKNKTIVNAKLLL